MASLNESPCNLAEGPTDDLLHEDGRLDFREVARPRDTNVECAKCQRSGGLRQSQCCNAKKPWDKSDRSSKKHSRYRNFQDTGPKEFHHMTKVYQSSLCDLDVYLLSVGMVGYDARFHPFPSHIKVLGH